MKSSGDILVTVRITNREIRFLRLRCEGRTYAEIAKVCGVSISTAKYYGRTLLPKIGIESRRGNNTEPTILMLRWAIENGIVVIPVKRRAQK